MTPNPQTIIEKWIGPDKPKGQHNCPDSHLATDVHNRSLADLRSRIPELVESIVAYLDLSPIQRLRATSRPVSPDDEFIPVDSAEGRELIENDTVLKKLIHRESPYTGEAAPEE